MIHSLRKTCRRAITTSAFAALLSVAPAKANEYSCRLPRALLCDGCANQIAITLQPGGGCRISFTLSAGQTAAPAKTPSDRLELRVEAEPVVITRFAPRRSTAWHTPAVAWVRPASSRRCFVFNSQQYCE
jgi:hypothetical protein